MSGPLILAVPAGARSGCAEAFEALISGHDSTTSGLDTRLTVEVAGSRQPIQLKNLSKLSQRERLTCYIGCKVAILVYNVADPVSFMDITIPNKNHRLITMTYQKELSEPTDLVYDNILLVGTYSNLRSDPATTAELRGKLLQPIASRQGEELVMKEGWLGYYEVPSIGKNELDIAQMQRVLTDAALCATGNRGRIPGKVEVTILSGEGMAAKDRNGKSDPYVKFGYVTAQNKFIDGLRAKTSVISNTLNPDYSRDKKAKGVFEPALSKKPVHAFMFEVWDKDVIGSDDFMGRAFLPLGFLSNPIKTEMVLELFPTEKKERGIKGELKFSVVCV
eukprot:TRINITY_DN3355_c0_g1_i1.p1 TRINITY_DN3355_c0_g1~~TRINITY_DN3355_c0_g1_i1.p1  ORF type:complete len:334 (-),score=57.22 TRINITY_DN3355_c0_g1_i1:78-1079(-)